MEDGSGAGIMRVVRMYAQIDGGACDGEQGDAGKRGFDGGARAQDGVEGGDEEEERFLVEGAEENDGEEPEPIEF